MQDRNVFNVPEDKINDSNTLELQSQDTSSEHFSSEESEAEMDDPNNQEAINKGVNESYRSRGRPKILRTGQRGRPKKMYQTNKITNQDSQTVSEALNRNDKEA